VPGVRSVGLVSFLPFSGSTARSTVTIEGAPLPPRGSPNSADISVCDRAYFETLGFSLREGRYFTEAEIVDRHNVAIVNETVARTYLGGHPLGRRVMSAITRPIVATEIVGVVGDARQIDLSTPPQPTIFWPLSQLPYSAMSMVIRTEVDPLSVRSA